MKKASPTTGFQARALLKKMYNYQKRQTRTIAAQLFIPVLLISLLFLLQLLVTSFIVDSQGEFTPARPRPQLSPSLMWLPEFLPDDLAGFCEAPADGEEADPFVVEETERDWLVAVTAEEAGASAAVGDLNLTFNELEGVPIPLPVVSESAGLFGNFSRNPLDYLAIKGRVFTERGNFQAFCPRQFYVAGPVTQRVADRKAMEDQLFDDYATLSRPAGVVINSIDRRKLAMNVLYNRTLTLGNDLPRLLSLLFSGLYSSTVVSDPERNMTTTPISVSYDGSRGFPTPRTANDFDLISIVGVTFYILVFQLYMPVVLGGIVQEKESRLREIMIMMGLKMPVYWVVTYLFYLLVYCFSTVFTIGIASLLGFRYFLANSVASYAVLLFLWGNLMMALSLLLSVFFSRYRTATVVGYLYVVGTGIIANSVMRTYYENDDTPPGVLYATYIVPSFLLYHGLLILSQNVSLGNPGLAWADIADPAVGMDRIYLGMFVEWLLLLLLAAYLEAVLPNSIGVKKHPLFFLGFGKEASAASASRPAVPDSEADDVAEERRAAESADSDAAVRLVGLHKRFKIAGLPDKVAVRNLSMTIRPGECFGFLGSNGAGKSTTINMLCGYFMPTDGTAYIAGKDIRTQIDAVHADLGVCPQDNVLWDDLTGEEHLRFFGELKGLSGDALEKAVVESLESVNLTSAGHKMSKEYSGGMKRRLCVAISLLGNPSVILLDEPSTGLDPASRRSLWDVILSKKATSSLLLTTHSMEEADYLCDRLGIFAHGALRCIGQPADLKNRFGANYKITVVTTYEHEAEVDAFLRELLPEVELISALAGTRNYEVPRSSIPLPVLFEALHTNAERLQIIDWGVANSTLEEVFLRITLEGEDGEDATMVVEARKEDDWHRKDLPKPADSAAAPSSAEAKPDRSVEMVVLDGEDPFSG